MTALLEWLALPLHGLAAVFVVAFVSATLAPIGSEPAVFGLVRLNPALMWPAIATASLGSTLGGAVTWWTGSLAQRGYRRLVRRRPQARSMRWLEAWGPSACLLSWLPIVGDPLCAAAGWLHLPFWPCVAYMAVGKFARYLVMTLALLFFLPP